MTITRPLGIIIGTLADNCNNIPTNNITSSKTHIPSFESQFSYHRVRNKTYQPHPNNGIIVTRSHNIDKSITNNKPPNIT